MNGQLQVEAVFVIHQDVPLERLRRASAEFAGGRILVLTSNKPFSTEVPRFSQVGGNVEVLSFADLLDDESMVACDAAATKICAAESGRVGRAGYARRFMRTSRRLKNDAIRDRIIAQYHPRRLYVADGLGIDSESWIVAGARSLSCRPARGAVTGIWRRLNRLLFQEINVLTPSCGGRRSEAAVVLGTAKRICIKEDVVVSQLKCLNWWAGIPNVVTDKHFERTVASIIRDRGADDRFVLCSTVHGYSTAMSDLAGRLGRTLYVLVDGHHPSNYTASYIDGFDECVFVAANYLSAKWFENHHRRVAGALWFQQPERFAKCDISDVRSVMLALNHAGDWSALINRSDTDLLIEGFARLAGRHKETEFIVRMHPTMATVDHEGVNSMHRIRAFVTSLGYANLMISERTLAEDLTRCDLYVSEYSQVLIDAWKRGRLGIAVNPTSRRSFMSDYQRLGFPHVAGLDSLRSWFEGLGEKLGTIVAEQNDAVERFNKYQEEWELAQA
jgi:hypothetical protein